MSAVSAGPTDLCRAGRGLSVPGLQICVGQGGVWQCRAYRPVSGRAGVCQCRAYRPVSGRAGSVSAGPTDLCRAAAESAGPAAAGCWPAGLAGPPRTRPSRPAPAAGGTAPRRRGSPAGRRPGPRSSASGTCRPHARHPHAVRNSHGGTIQLRKVTKWKWRFLFWMEESSTHSFLEKKRCKWLIWWFYKVWSFPFLDFIFSNRFRTFLPCFRTDCNKRCAYSSCIGTGPLLRSCLFLGLNWTYQILCTDDLGSDLVFRVHVSSN